MTLPSDQPKWLGIPEIFRTSAQSLPPPWEAIFGPLRSPVHNDLIAIGQIGQSLDGRIATASGHSHYVNGEAGLAHLHRLRALVDAVVIGIGTALADDPRLTVRRVEGPHPARAVIDPRGRLPHNAAMLAADGVRRIVVTDTETQAGWPAGVEILRLAGPQMAPFDILAALRASGFRRVLIEGGAATVSRFLAAGCLDRLHVVVAPVIIGSGPAGLSLDRIERMDQALRPPIHVHRLDDEVLFDCDLSAQRALGIAKKST